MAQIPEHLLFSGQELDRESSRTLQSQIFDLIRTAVLSGQLAAGYRLPSTRALSEQWEVSRTTVVNVFEQLIAEGYLVAKSGSGTLVAPHLSEKSALIGGVDNGDGASHFHAKIAERGQKILDEYESRRRAMDIPRPFRPGIPAIGSFPTLLWRRISSQIWRNTNPHDVSEMEQLGHRPFREEIAGYVREARGVNCNPDNIFVVSSTQHAISMICQVLINPDDSIAVESPGYPRAFAAFAAHGIRQVGVPVDHEGMTLGKNVEPKAIYTTPSYQYPLGITMTLQRRLDLLQWARSHKAWIIEDDYASEFRYEGRPVKALQGLDADQRVIYLGTFNKMFSPALRLGYMIVPDSLVDAFTATRSLIDRCPAFIDQAVLAEFIARGHFGRHIRKLRTLYLEREEYLRGQLNEKFPMFEVPPVHGGMHLLARLPEDVSDVEVCDQLTEGHVFAKPLSSFFLRKTPSNAILFGFAAWDKSEVDEAIERMEKILLP